jgi:hypothetical protein
MQNFKVDRFGEILEVSPYEGGVTIELFESDGGHRAETTHICLSRDELVDLIAYLQALV